MSKRIPPESPRKLSDEEVRALMEYGEEYMRALGQTTSGGESPSSRAVERPPLLLATGQAGLSGWVTTALQSVTLVAIVGCAFWLGSLSTTVSNTSQKLDKLNDGIVGISRDSLSNRLIAIETKLDILNTRIEAGSGAPPQKKPSAMTLSRVAVFQYPQSPKVDR